MQGSVNVQSETEKSGIVQFACPECLSDLETDSKYLICNSCNNKYNINEGVPIFSKNKAYYGEIPKDELDDIIFQLRNRTYENCLENISTNTAELLEYLLRENRCNGLNVLDLNWEDLVLDLGSGFGGLSLYLAEKCKQVHAVEWVEEKSHFVRSIAKQRGINNLKCIKADCRCLPYKSETFTKIIMNGFLEWVPLEFTNLNPKSAQKKVLSRCFDMLKPGGELFVGIENRFWINYFLGYPDPHERKLHFVTIIPRFLANMMSHLLRKKPYRTYIYSWRGYERLMKSAGFRSVNIYGALPNYVTPIQIVEGSTINEFYLREMEKSKNIYFKMIKKILITLGLSKTFLHSFIIVAKK